VNYKLIVEFAKRDLSDKYSGSIIGVGWAFINPLIMIFIYTIIFSKIMGAKLPGIDNTYSYSIYLVSGLLAWNSFSSTIRRISTLFIDNKGLLSKINISLATFGLYIVLAESVTFFVNISIFIAFLLITGAEISWVFLLFPILFIVQQVFAYGLGLLFAIFTVFIRDLKEIVNIFIQFWFWFTPIIYIVDILPSFAKPLLIYNPAYWFIDSYHAIFVYNKLPKLEFTVSLLISSFVLLFLAFFILKKLEKDIRDFV
jgi:lipopolysaccharide transport system permease protein